MLEIDTVRTAMQHVNWYPGDELSDLYWHAIDEATTDKPTPRGRARAFRAVIELSEPQNDEFIRRQLSHFELSPHIIGLESAYDSTMVQVHTLLGFTSGQQG